MSDYDRQFHEAHGASGRPAGFGRGAASYDRGQVGSGLAASQWREDLRHRGRQGYQRLVGAYEEAEGRARAQVPLRERLARQAVSGAVAAGVGGVAWMRGGGTAAAMGQAGLTGGLAGIRERIAGQKAVDQAAIGAAQAGVEAISAEREMSSKPQEHIEAKAAAVPQIEQAISDGTGDWFTDEDAIDRKIRSIIEEVRATSPSAAAELEAMYPPRGGTPWWQVNKWRLGY